VETALAHLHQARDRLHHLDQTQAQAAPLLQRRQQLLAQIDRNATRLTARLEDLQTSVQQLQTQQARQPQLQQAVLEVSDRIETLEQRRSRQQEVRERGMERRSFMERLQAHQRDYEAQLAEVEQKIHLLRQGVGKELIELPATGQISLLKVAETNGNGLYSLAAPRVAAFPPCPLCDRPLDEQHWKLVLEKHQIEQEETLQQIWGIREQLSASEREIQVMRQEYIRLEKELMQYGSTMERRGQLQAQLQQTTEVQTALQQVIAETATLERSLQTGDYARELQEELQLLDRSLQQLDYDERDHALARGEVDRWRWAEIKHAEIRQAQRKQAQIAQQLPQLQSQITQLQTVLTQLQQETATHLAAFDQHLSEIGYDVDRHEEFRQAIRQAQPWQLHQQELHRAQQIYPQIQQRSQELTQALQERQHHLQTVQTQTDTLVQQLEQLPDRQTQIHTLEQQIQQRRSHLDQQLAHLGRLQQQQQQQATLTQQQTHLTHQRQLLHRKLQVYQELTQAFGKNGIQTLMIENVLPQLEAETNQILSRLSANQLHVQFVTQRFQRRESRVAKLNSQPAKAIETLDILIADAQGTRPYETYSGGEAFRVNFAIRLALSRLLAQRSGTSLQMLIIDEGFGTQDAEGCDRLIAAINAIAPDFACILAVTHVPHLKEAFQSRIEVYKTANGSQLTLSV
jgi:exonuclease SbcC